MVHAACRGLDKDTLVRLFFPETGLSSEAGKKICNGKETTRNVTGHQGCPVREHCLEYALSFPVSEIVGVWGGTSQSERAVIAHERELDTRRMGR